MENTSEPKLNIPAKKMKHRYTGRLISFGELLNLMENDNLEVATGKFNYYNAHFVYSDQRNFHTTRFLEFHWKNLAHTHPVRLGTCDCSDCTQEEIDHITYVFDRIAMPERIKNDDPAVLDIVQDYSLELIAEYLDLAIKSNSDQLVAGLMNLKHDKEQESSIKIETDPFDEFEL